LRARIAVLTNEITEKAAMIENATFEKQDLDRTLDRLRKAQEAPIDSSSSQQNDIKTQQTIMQKLNDKYREALTEKVSAYQSLIDNLKFLTDKQSQFVKNEVEMTRL
jgi:hypothetical protein